MGKLGLKKLTNNKKIHRMIDERDDGLPAFPSAQWWFNSSVKDKKDLELTVGENWEDYKQEMMKHWPSEKKFIRVKRG